MKITCHADKKVSAPMNVALLAALLWNSAVFSQAEAAAPEVVDESTNTAPEAKKSKLLPDLDTLVNAKLDALNKKLEEQKVELSKIDYALEKERQQQQRIFDEQAYLSMSMVSSLPPQEYRLLSTEVLVNGSVVSRGGQNNRGLPRNHERIYFAPLAMGCHEVLVRAKVVRLKNDLISRFKGLNREETIERRLTINPKAGYHLDIGVDIFEAPNSIAQFFRKPEIRFNRLVQPNFLKGAPLVSNEAVMQQGQVRITYVNDDNAQQILVNKTISIDGLPILSNKAHDQSLEKDVVFEAPLAEGRHVLQATLVFGQKTWIEGGPSYKFSLKFEREVYVRGGSRTAVQLIGMPDGGNRRNPRDARYVRIISEISAEEEQAMFPEQSCREQALVHAARAKADNERVKEESKVLEPVKSEASSSEEVPPPAAEEAAPKVQGE